MPMTNEYAEARGWIPVHRQLPEHDEAVRIMVVRHDGPYATGTARRKGIRWFFADDGREMPETPTHWRKA